VAVLQLKPEAFWDFSKVYLPLSFYQLQSKSELSIFFAISFQNRRLIMQALFDDAKSYYDVNIVNETRNQTYKRLAKLGGSVGVSEDKLLNKLWISDKPAEDGSLNTGNSVTNDLKVLVKFNRKQGIHVTPTVVSHSRMHTFLLFIIRLVNGTQLLAWLATLI